MLISGIFWGNYLSKDCRNKDSNIHVISDDLATSSAQEELDHTILENSSSSVMSYSTPVNSSSTTSTTVVSRPETLLPVQTDIALNTDPIDDYPGLSTDVRSVRYLCCFKDITQLATSIIFHFFALCLMLAKFNAQYFMSCSLHANLT